MSVGYNDSLDRDWGRHFLINVKGKESVINGPKYGRDIEDVDSNYGADVEDAQKYNPITRPRPISIPYRKSAVGKYWSDHKDTDYIQWVDNQHRQLIYISSETIKKYKDSPIRRGNLPYERSYTWKGFTFEQCKEIWNSYIEIPKSEVEIWERIGIGKESKYLKKSL
jgi:hypothetical protein